jgi:hypothetical protein
VTQETIKKNFTEGKIHKEKKMVGIGLFLVAAFWVMIALTDKNVEEAHRKFYERNLDKFR